MQSHYAAEFDREMGCTLAEWLMWLPAAMGDVHWQQQGQGLKATWHSPADANLGIQWRVGEPRRIALLHMPRLHVQFKFQGLDEVQRYAFMKRFDLYMQRGGG